MNEDEDGMNWDCFTFNNEFDVLDIRLHELNQVIDYFVIAESNMTHSGLPKPLYLKAALEGGMFSEFRDKIIRIEIDLSDKHKPWDRENKQRNALMEVMTQANDADLIFVSDADEIPSKEFIFKRDVTSPVQYPFLLSKQFFYYYNFKQRKKEECHGTIGFYKCSLEKHKETFQTLRDKRFHLPGIPSSGWHLSFFGSPSQIQNKIDSLAHTEFQYTTNEEKIMERIKKGLDIHGRTNTIEELVAIKDNTDVPEYVLENKEKYKELF